jgi:outer membrane protein assembly factor BamB
MQMLRRCLFAFFILIMSSALPVAAQPQCGVVEQVMPPVDTSLFQLMQDYGVPNYRHRGWFHTGEDWWGGRGQSLGQPVRAIANGRVTFASPLAWGRDGGVVILEHTFADGSIYYSQYGHIAESEGVSFPRPFTCVLAGALIGVIAESRPAPHLHFEIRINNFDLAGPGYTEADPFTEGYRRPAKMIANWQAHLSDAHLWHVDLIDEAGPLTPPIVLSDNSLIYLDSGRVSRLTNDGRVLWRYNLEQAAVALLPDGDAVVIVYASGRMQRINADGAPGDLWETGVSLAGAPLPFAALWLLPTNDGALVALDAAARTILWRLADVPSIVYWATSSGILALVTTTQELLVVDETGALLARQPLNGAGGVSPLTDGRLQAYAGGALWTIDAPYAAAAVSQASGSPLLAAPDGGSYIFEGGAFTALDATQQVRYQYAVPNVSGAFRVFWQDGIILLVGQHGYIYAIRAADGALCGSVRVFGDDRARIWQALGQDGVLRVAVADQIIGLDWQALRGSCVV